MVIAAALARELWPQSGQETLRAVRTVAQDDARSQQKARDHGDFQQHFIDVQIAG